MIFKKNWERSTELFKVPETIIERMVEQAMPHNKLLFYQFISEGCSNLSVKIQIDEPGAPLFILKVYFVNEEGPFMERISYRLLGHSVPIPCIHYIGRYENYQFSIAQFLQGKPLREFLLANPSHQELEAMMFNVGVLLARISNFQFPMSGIFNRDLVFLGGCSQEGYLHFINLFLKKEIITIHLTTALISKIQHFTEVNKNLFPRGEEKNFVHGDFDANNVFVDCIEGEWKITGVLDWESPFSGSIFCDISNMLRYRRHMPPVFANAFLEALRHEKISIPNDWSQRVDLLNVLSLLSCLAKTNPEKSPLQCEDICRLLGEIVE